MKYILEPDIQRPLTNPLASEQVVRTMKITKIFQEYKPKQKRKQKENEWFVCEI